MSLLSSPGAKPHLLFLISDFMLLLCSSKFVGEFQLQLEGEQELVHFTVRTLKVGKSDQFKLARFIAYQSASELQGLTASN